MNNHHNSEYRPLYRSSIALYRSRSSVLKKKMTRAVAQAKAPANKPQATPA
jgi:hypothetical protein